MRKPGILFMLLALVAAIALVPAVASAATDDGSLQPVTTMTSMAEQGMTAASSSTATKESPKLNLTKVTLPANTNANGNGYTWLWVKGTSKNAKWSTSNDKVVTIHKFKTKNMVQIDAMKKGTATVTAKVGNKTLKCKVTVTKPMSKKALTKKVKVDASTVGKQYITLKNTSKYYLKAIVRVHIINNSGGEADWCDTNYVKLAPDKSQKAYVRNLYGYSKCKYEMESVFIDYEYHKVSAKATVKPVTGNTLPIVIKNNSKYTDYLYALVSFKKNGKIVWIDQAMTNKALKPGKSDTVSIFLNDRVPEYDSVSVQVIR